MPTSVIAIRGENCKQYSAPRLTDTTHCSVTVDSTNFHAFGQVNELYCVLIDLGDNPHEDSFILSYLLGTVKLIHHILIQGDAVPIRSDTYHQIVSVLCNRHHNHDHHDQQRCQIHELTLSHNIKKTKVRTASGRIVRRTAPLGIAMLAKVSDLDILQLARLNLQGENFDITGVDISNLKTLEICMNRRETAASLVNALNDQCKLHHFKITGTKEIELPHELFERLCRKLNRLLHLETLFVTVGNFFPASIIHFARSVPPPVKSLTIQWERQHGTPDLSDFAPAASQLTSLSIRFPPKMPPNSNECMPGILPLLYACREANCLQHLSIGSLRASLTYSNLSQLVTALASMTSLLTLKLTFPLQLDTPCRGTIRNLIQSNHRLREFSYLAVGPKTIHREFQFYVKLNRIRYHDVLQKGRLARGLWPHVLTLRRQQQQQQQQHQEEEGWESVVYELLQQCNNDLIPRSYRRP